MGGDAVVTDKEYNYLASMADDGLLRVGGRPVDVDKRGCGRGYNADVITAASPAVSPAIANAAATGSVFTPPLPTPFRQSSL